MRKRLTEYMKRTEALLNSVCKNGEDEFPDYEELCKQHLIQIQFFQHERLIHLMVTCLFALLAFALFITLLFTFSVGLLVLFALVFILLIPYIRHYYFLENGVQRLYAQYDRLYDKAMKK